MLYKATGEKAYLDDAILAADYVRNEMCDADGLLPFKNGVEQGIYAAIFAQYIIAWTEGNALVATGSPFNPVVWKDKIYPIAQCNNAFIFPGIGLGVIASGASRITDEMLMSASEMLAQYSPLVLNGEGLVLPELKDIQKVSRAIAFAVGKMAQQQGVAVKTSAEALQQAIDDNFWHAEYRDYRRTSI